MPDVPGLSHLPRWLVWTLENRHGVPTKIPHDPKTGGPASTTDPSTWGTYEVAHAAAATKRYDGCGFVLGDGIAGIDLDKCRTLDTRTLEPWAQHIINRMTTYTEVSPSGTGIHLLFRGTLPPGARRFLGRVEMYDIDRYFTVTGQALNSAAVEERTDTAAALHADLTDAHTFLRAAKRQQANVTQLWAGDTSPWGNDDSSADFALARLLADYAIGDAGRIDRLFRLSGLYRPKWDESRGDTTYGGLTIRKAMEDTADAGSPLIIVRRRWRDIIDHPKAEPTMLVDDLFLSDHINMIAGYAYAGKSTAALDVAISVAAGLPVFQHFPVTTPGPVVYLYAEQGESSWESRLRAIGAFRGIAPKADLPIELNPAYDIRLNDPAHLEKVLEILRDLRARLLVVDPLSTICQVTDENSAADIIQHVRIPLQTIVSTTGATVIILHHSTKGATWTEPHSASDLVRGSGDLTALTGAILGVWASRGRNIVKAIPLVRGPMASPFTLAPKGLTPSDPQHGLPAPSTSFEPVAYAGSWESPDEHDPAVKFYMEHQGIWTGGALTPKAVAEQTGLSQPTVYRYLKRLKELGMLTQGPNGLTPTSGTVDPAPVSPTDPPVNF